jgi:hypothetical protein
LGRARPRMWRRLTIAGRVDALKRGEDPKEVFGRCGSESGKGVLEAAFRRASGS